MIDALNLATGETRQYFDSGEFGAVRMAVICAYAQNLKNIGGTTGDWNTWQYEEKYGRLVEYAGRCVTCGDWTAINRPGPDDR